MARDIVIGLGCSGECRFGDLKTVPLNPSEAIALAKVASGGMDGSLMYEAEPDNGFRVPLHIVNTPSKVSQVRINMYKKDANNPFSLACEQCVHCDFSDQLSEFSGQLATRGLIDNSDT